MLILWQRKWVCLKIIKNKNNKIWMKKEKRISEELILIKKKPRII